MKVLIVNAGSSSLKYQLLDMDTEAVIAKGQAQRIGIPGSSLDMKTVNAETGKFTTAIEYVEDIPNHEKACALMLKALTDGEKGVVKSMDEINAVGHRVLHGGEKFCQSMVIDEAVKDAIKEFIPLGPLHNPANLMGIEACQAVMPNTPQVAVFDTAFHMTMPEKAFMYGVPYDYYAKRRVRRYGFHGTSHRYVSKRVCEFLGVSPEGKKVIVCHLGNGSSLSAVKDGKCVDTSMGITPLEGLLMGTRCGSCDPAVVQYICNNPLDKNGKPMEGKLDVDTVLNMMNKSSGLMGITMGYSSDMRDVEDAVLKGKLNEDQVKAAYTKYADEMSYDEFRGEVLKRTQLAWDMLVYQISKLIGSYAAGMGGVDIIAFTAGIGENGPELREDVIKNLAFLGAEIDKSKNDGLRGKETVISTPDSKVTVCVIPTNEEIMIARDTIELVAKA